MTPEAELRKAMKFQLPEYDSKKYWEFMKKKGFDRHHCFGKYHGLFLVHLTREEHQKRQLAPDRYVLQDMIQSLTNLINYVKFLEEAKFQLVILGLCCLESQHLNIKDI